MNSRSAPFAEGGAIRRIAARGGRSLVGRGLHPRWLGYHHVERVDLDALADPTSRGVVQDLVHDDSVSDNPLPRNIEDRNQLPKDRGWWGYSMHDVPARHNGPTFVARIRDATISGFRDDAGDYHPAILDSRGRSLDLREIRFRDSHRSALKTAPVLHLERATWIVERVYHNHSHWLNAHLPKLLVLRDRQQLDDLVLPADLSSVAESSLRRLGIDPDTTRRVDPTHTLSVDQLTIVGNDRFRPELLRMVRDEMGDTDAVSVPFRRIYVSRARAMRRRLVNEMEIESMLGDDGFESVFLEDLSFDEQVRLMAETTVLCGPHGAGLTNMIFCPPGTHVVEFADLGFPNPNFYAMSAALGHHHWLLAADSVGNDQHPLERDMRVDLDLVADTIEEINAS